MRSSGDQTQEWKIITVFADTLSGRFVERQYVR